MDLASELASNNCEAEFHEDPEKHDFRNILLVTDCLSCSLLSWYLLGNPYGSYIPIASIVILEWCRTHARQKRSYYGLCRLSLYVSFIAVWNVLIIKFPLDFLSWLTSYQLPFTKIQHLFPYALIFTSFARTRQDLEVSHARRYIIHVLYDIPAFILVIIFKLLNNPLNSLCSEITPFCYLGCLPLPSDVKQLSEIPIACVVNMCAEYPGPKKTYEKYHIEQLHLPTVDTALPSRKTIERAVAFIREASNENKKVFVHCKAGMGRSAAVVYCHLIANENMSPKEALKLLKEKRAEVSTTIIHCPSVLRFLASLKKTTN